MGYREQIESKSQEFRNVLSYYMDLKGTGKAGNCSYINTYKKVTYKPSGEGRSRIGKIHDNLDKKHIHIRLDLPKGEFSDEFLLKTIGLEIFPRQQRTNFTCLKVHRASWDNSIFDTIDIKLYREHIATYDFSSSAFLDFLNLLILRATGEIAEIPNN